MTAPLRFAFFLSSILSLLVAAPARAAASSEDFHARVVALYGFHPREMTDEQVTAKSVELDAFWSQAKADPARVLPLLREELAKASDADFFAYDGAKLLLSISTDRADTERALVALPKVDLRDIDPTDYLQTVQRLGAKGLDTRAAAFRLLADPEFKAFIPAHVLTLGQNYALIYLLFPMPQATFEKDLVARLDAEQDARSQKSLLLAVWYLMTPDAVSALKTFADRPGVDASSAAYARELLGRSSGVNFSFSGAASLRESRMQMMRRPISDEALIEFDGLTLKLMSKL